MSEPLSFDATLLDLRAQASQLVAEAPLFPLQILPLDAHDDLNEPRRRSARGHGGVEAVGGVSRRSLVPRSFQCQLRREAHRRLRELLFGRQPHGVLVLGLDLGRGQLRASSFARLSQLGDLVLALPAHLRRLGPCFFEVLAHFRVVFLHRRSRRQFRLELSLQLCGLSL
ncbi:MAG: hypothetical protein AAF658_03515 [Myxococcota bacterium]